MRHAKTHLAAAVLAACVPFAASAAESSTPPPVTGNVMLATDYVFRGISQSDENVAIQGGLDYAHPSGFYLGTWGSNVDFSEDESVLDGATMELDIYGGYKMSLSKEAILDLGLLLYWYPGAASERNYDFYEVYAKLGYDFGFMQALAGVQYSPDFFAGSDDAWYYFAEATIPIAEGFSGVAHIGYQDIKDETAFGAPSYTEWKLGVTTSFVGLNFGLFYTDTDLSDADCFAGTDLCGGRAVLTVSKSL
jgi:uncharacterized protein (TIGR02001 family)